MAAAIGLALLMCACGSSTQRMIVGKWEADGATKVTAEFNRDGTAKLSMFGRSLEGTYTLTADNELEWTLNGIMTKDKVNVTANELDITDDGNRIIKYQRK